MRTLLLLAIIFLARNAFSQGTVYFSTRVAGLVDAPVGCSATGEGLGPSWSAELGVVAPQGSFTPVPNSITTFRSATAEAPALSRYVVPITVEIPGVPAGGSVNLAMRGFLTSAGSYDAAPASLRFMTPAVTVVGLGGGILPPANLIGLQGPAIPLAGGPFWCVPEPSTTVLLILGAGLMTAARCRKCWRLPARRC